MAVKCFWPCLKAVARTFFYQFFLLLVLCSVVVITVPDQVGFRAMTLHMSYINHFHPITFERALPMIKAVGQFRIWCIHGHPEDFEVLEQAVAAEEWYWCKYQYTDVKGITRIGIESIRIRWKPWEYYYDLQEESTDEDIKEYIEKGSLNSHETDKAWKLRDELRRMEQERTEV